MCMLVADYIMPAPALVSGSLWVGVQLPSNAAAVGTFTSTMYLSGREMDSISLTLSLHVQLPPDGIPVSVSKS